jgi:hypothetical protein
VKRIEVVQHPRTADILLLTTVKTNTKLVTELYWPDVRKQKKAYLTPFSNVEGFYVRLKLHFLLTTL